jgi:superfamily II helicase
MTNFYCLICKRLAGDVITMPRGSDYAGQAVCVRCACEHFDKAIKKARERTLGAAVGTETVTIGYWSVNP